MGGRAVFVLCLSCGFSVYGTLQRFTCRGFTTLSIHAFEYLLNHHSVWCFVLSWAHTRQKADINLPSRSLDREREIKFIIIPNNYLITSMVNWKQDRGRFFLSLFLGGIFVSFIWRWSYMEAVTKFLESNMGPESSQLDSKSHCKLVTNSSSLPLLSF